VLRAVSGYTGGTVDKPTYEQVSSKATGHYEAVQVTYDPSKVSYPQLVDWFWRNIDPLDAKGQFCDQGSPITPASSSTTKSRKRSPRRASRRWRRRAASRRRSPPRFSPPAVLGGRGLPPGLLQEKPDPISVLQDRCGRAARLEQIWAAVQAAGLTQ